jgi:hypothetical protein
VSQKGNCFLEKKPVVAMIVSSQAKWFVPQRIEPHTSGSQSNSFFTECLEVEVIIKFEHLVLLLFVLYCYIVCSGCSLLIFFSPITALPNLLAEDYKRYA